MRTIKFRAWSNGKMVYQNNALSKMSRFWRIIEQAKEHGEEVVIMQFTGLHDKNGKEIYEGDIVNSHANFELPYFREVVYDRCGLTFKPRSGFILCKENEFHFDVIGNIYENPELLTPQH